MKVINRSWILKRAFLVFVLLLTPILEVLIVKIEDRYSIGSTSSLVTSKLAYIGKKTFSSEGAIDILFSGPSSVWVGVDALKVQEILRYMTGRRDIVVENFAHHKMGYEVDYYILRELTARRKVKAVVLGLEDREQIKVHRMARSVWNPLEYPETFQISSKLYAEKFLDSLSMIIKSPFHKAPQIPIGITRTNGAHLSTAGYSEGSIRKDFVPKSLPSRHIKYEDFHLKPEDKIVTGKHTELQEYFLRKIIAFTEENDIDLYFMHVPSLQPAYYNKVPVLSFRDPAEVKTPTLGIPASRMFGGEPWEMAQDFFYNEEHFNLNGADGFSVLIIPAMKRIYERTNH